uniref:PA domain-containing protein n=1 Tax=Oryza nivara TaxID=4536 RepID=A0A0E0GHB1_ORYNI
MDAMAVCCSGYLLGAANVVLMGTNLTLSFDDVEASFAPGVKGSGFEGVVYTAEPLDACSPLTSKAEKGPPSPFALIIRGGCTFDEKVKNAQDAGFKAAIVYDNENSGVLISMAGSSGGIHIYAVFISKASGEVLKKFSGHTDVEVWILPAFENSAWSIMAISFISLLAMSAVLATCFFVRRHHIRRDWPRIPEAREFHGMSSQLVKAMPSLIFTKVQEDNCTSSMCAICLEDYKSSMQLVWTFGSQLGELFALSFAFSVIFVPVKCGSIASKTNKSTTFITLLSRFIQPASVIPKALWGIRA